MAISVLLSVGFCGSSRPEVGFLMAPLGSEELPAASYLGDLVIILRCQSGFHCETSCDENMDTEISKSTCQSFTFAVDLHAVELDSAVALLPHQPAVSITQVHHQTPAHLRQVSVLLLLQTQPQ